MGRKHVQGGEETMSGGGAMEAHGYTHARAHTHTHTFMHGEAAIIPATVVYN